MSIKAIETRYKGYRFRSRLEARWAVWLDAIGAEWEYEPQGYVLDSTPYLPDFRVKLHRFEFADYCWLEIKPGPLSENEKHLLCLLADNDNRPALALAGDCWFDDSAIYLASMQGGFYFFPPRFCPLCNGSGMLDLEKGKKGKWKGCEYDIPTYYDTCFCSNSNAIIGWIFRFLISANPWMPMYAYILPEEISPYSVEKVFSAAFSAARSARFEHGESWARKISASQED